MVYESVIGATCTCLAVISFSANSALLNRGNGLIYDEELDITWLQDANYAQTSGYDTDGLMIWDEAIAWAGQLEYHESTDWRLANMDVDNDGNVVTCQTGIICLDNELGHMYYFNFGGSGEYLFGDQAPFTGIRTDVWSSTKRDANTFRYKFGFDGGTQNVHTWSSKVGTWAVHDGDIGATVVPIPSAAWLFGSGLLGLVGIARRKVRV